MCLSGKKIIFRLLFNERLHVHTEYLVSTHMCKVFS